MEENKDRDAKFEEQLKLFENMEVPYKRTKEEVWEAMTQKMTSPPSKKIIPLYLTRWAAAAVILIISGLGFMRFYTTNVYSANGEHLAHTLPDDSVVRLNAGSSLSYAPYWWVFERAVSLDGEAFFEVEKGSRFVVNSDLGYTEVLGTSFNIYARDTIYQVFCKTGKVGVHATNSDQSIVLIPNEKGVLKNNVLTKEVKKDGMSSMGWMNDKFYLNNIAFKRAIEEVERQFDVTIELDKNLEQEPYSGFFDKEKRIQTVLEIMTESLDLELTKKDDKTYSITSNY